MTIDEYFGQLLDEIFDNVPDIVALYQNIKDINFESKSQKYLYINELSVGGE
jgi:hypothetical protein